MSATLATGRGRAGRLLRAVPGLQIEHRPDPAVSAVRVITSHLDCGEVVAAGQLAAQALKRRPGHRQLTDLHIAARSSRSGMSGRRSATASSCTGWTPTW